jgi:hypothetical protein
MPALGPDTLPDVIGLLVIIGVLYALYATALSK